MLQNTTAFKRLSYFTSVLFSGRVRQFPQHLQPWKRLSEVDLAYTNYFMAEHRRKKLIIKAD
jgi:hypothetical protein